MNCYMAVTLDKYELPLCIRDSAEEMGKRFGLSAKTVEWYCTPSGAKKSRKQRGYRIIKVRIEDD